MKTIILSLSFGVFGLTLFSQTSAYFNQTNTSESSTFDDGWEEGYKEAFEAYGLDAFIIPISPIVLANEADTYRAGYSRGYQKALEDLKDVDKPVDYNYLNSGYLPTSAYFNQSNASESSTFDDGWEEGYKEAFEAYGLDAFIIPISPVVLANEADTYRAGYSRGYQKALEDLKD